VLALSAADGATAWRTPLKFNPWSGVSVAGGLVLVGTSNIRFDPKLLAVAKGEVVALDQASGTLRWRSAVPGGVVSSVAVAAEAKLVVFAATDGKLRAIGLEDGQIRWEYSGGAPFFAAPALAGDAVYAADLNGVVHCAALADGQPRWKLDLAGEPVKAPGMVYGSPVVAGGRLYVATCNLEGANTRLPSVLVAIGDK
jgi:outer membrane protein assembly factor BamB